MGYNQHKIRFTAIKENNDNWSNVNVCRIISYFEPSQGKIIFKNPESKLTDSTSPNVVTSLKDKKTSGKDSSRNRTSQICRGKRIVTV